MTLFSDPTSRRFAMIAGLFYLTIAVSGGYSIAYVPYALYGDGQPTDILNAISTQRGLFLSGIAGDVVMMAAEVMVTAMLFFMFRAVNPTLSLAAALARFAMVAVMAAMLFFQAGLLAMANGALPMDGAGAEAKDALAGLLLYMHDAGVWIWQVFFTIHLLLLGTLILNSGMFPKVLGAGLLVGGMGYLVDSIYAFAFPGAEWLGLVRVGLLGIVTLSEVGFALWLVFVGPRKPLDTAAATS